jgi:hypothetical protein
VKMKRGQRVGKGLGIEQGIDNYGAQMYEER